jgi:hypothetical protein
MSTIEELRKNLDEDEQSGWTSITLPIPEVRALLDAATPKPAPLPSFVVALSLGELRYHTSKEGAGKGWVEAADVETVAAALADLQAQLADLQAQLAAKGAECGELRNRMFDIGDGVSCAADFVEAAVQVERERAESSEAKLTRVMEWMRGRCECCGNDGDRALFPIDHPCVSCIRRPNLGTSDIDNWTPPKAWEGE